MDSTEQSARHYRPEKSSSEETAKTVEIGFHRLALRCLGELWLFHLITSALLGGLMYLLREAASMLLASRGAILTTATLKEALLSWQGITLIVCAVVVMTLYIAIDLFAHIFFCDRLLHGREEGSLRRAFGSVKDALVALPRFLTPTGLPTLIFIALLVPIAGVGFSVGLTRHFYIPSFIKDVIVKTPHYLIPYLAILVVLIICGILHIFTIHGVLLDNLSPNEARRRSRYIIKNHPLQLLKDVLSAAILPVVIYIVVSILFTVAIVALKICGGELPIGFHTNIVEKLINDVEVTDLDLAVTMYRTLCAFATLIWSSLFGIVALLFDSYLLLVSTHLYRWLGSDECDGRVAPRYLRFKIKRHYLLRIFVFLGTLLFFAALSIIIGVWYDDLMLREEPVAVVVHRLGGSGAPENSLEGLEASITQGCYGAETDVQRTKDGYYIINHDDTFERLTGVNLTPQDMTLDEVKELKIHDMNYPDELVEIPTLEETLEASKGNITLFIELKGATADQQMVDDVVRTVREFDAVNDVMLISLSYDCISYAETTYPEFQTGLLIFGAYGNPDLLNCDVILTEEESATESFVNDVHDAGKKIGVWTVNSWESMHRFLDSKVDYIITDNSAQAAEVQGELDNRDDLAVIMDHLMLYKERGNSSSTASLSSYSTAHISVNRCMFDAPKRIIIKPLALTPSGRRQR